MFIKGETVSEIIIEKSRFITYLVHLEDEKQFKIYLNDLKKRYYDASHICYAFIFKNAKRCNDDGEPAKTAGMPILSILEKNNLINVACFVIRYFGGIKLGANGLVRAYQNACKEAINKAIKYEELVLDKYELSLDYDQKCLP